MTPVFLTVDTEFAGRHHAAGLDVEAIYARSVEPAGVGLSHHLALLARHNLKACFFVDPMPALVYGLKPVARMVEAVLAAGQEVQLHCHANWAGARAGSRRGVRPFQPQRIRPGPADRPARRRRSRSGPAPILSSAESGHALEHAARQRHAAVTIVSHSFALANRLGTGVNAVHVRRFAALCAMPAASRSLLPTVR